MKITSLKIRKSQLGVNEEALLRCRTALESRDRGDYQSALEAMDGLWSLGRSPNVEGLDDDTAGEVFLCAGVLTRWMGSRDESKESPEVARDLITRSITYFAGDATKISGAQIELAYCYWREGALREARVMFKDTLETLTGPANMRANAVIGLATVEWTASRFVESLKVLTEHASLIERISNNVLIGTYHNLIAMGMRQLTPAVDRDDHLEKVVKEYELADHYFHLAKNLAFRADVQNNLGLFLCRLSRFREAHAYLESARRLRSSMRDRIIVAQIDESRAQVFIVQGKYKEAEAIVRRSVSVLQESGHQGSLAEALNTHAISVARLGQVERAQTIFQRATEVAYRVGALNRAGLAALSMIEELDDVPTQTLVTAFERASEWLADSQGEEIWRRLSGAARKVFGKLKAEADTERAAKSSLESAGDLSSQVNAYERTLIRHALARVNGRLTQAATQLGVSYQSLAYIISTRHKDLLSERSPVQRRKSRRN